MYLLFDIGGTKMRLAVSCSGQRLDRVKVVSTPSSFREGMALFYRNAQELAAGTLVKAAVGGIPGPLNKSKSRVVNARNLPGWVGKPLKREISKIVRGSVFIENDTALAGLGEALYGAVKGYKIVVYYTISTGVGGVRIIDGCIDTNALGFEPGHQIVGTLDNQPVYLEDLTSGSGLQNRFQKDTKQITDPTIWQEVARFIAYGLNNSIVHWSPEVVVLGGGLILNSPLRLSDIRYYLEQSLRVFPAVPPIKKARLGDQGGLYGALAFLRQKLLFKNG